MTRINLMGALMAAGLVMGIASCNEDPVRPADVEPRLARVEQMGSDKDARRAELLDELPGFAGYFREGGRLVVMMVEDRSSASEAREVIREYLRGRTRNSSPEGVALSLSRADNVVTRPAQYDLRQLVTWKRQLSELATSNAEWVGIRI